MCGLTGLCSLVRIVGNKELKSSHLFILRALRHLVRLLPILQIGSLNAVFGTKEVVHRLNGLILGRLVVRPKTCEVL